MPRVFSNRLIGGGLTPFLAGVVLAILAPFGTDQFSAPLRFLYWIGLACAGGLGALAVDFILRRKAPNLSIWIWAALQSAGATLAVSPFVFFLYSQPGLGSVLATLFYIWVIAIVITVVGHLAGRRQYPSNPRAETVVRPLIIDRLPPKFRDAEIYAISSEDHYVRIHSAVGEYMMLMRLSDAEDLALPLIGLKPHRSWWVAEAGVEEISKPDGKLQIMLKSGIHVPVSREGRKRLREAGWF